MISASYLVKHDRPSSLMLTIGAVRFAWPMRYVTSLFFPHEFQQRKPPAPKAKALVHCPDKLSGKFDPEKKNTDLWKENYQCGPGLTPQGFDPPLPSQSCASRHACAGKALGHSVGTRK
jgi:hypothetical protein